MDTVAECRELYDETLVQKTKEKDYEVLAQPRHFTPSYRRQTTEPAAPHAAVQSVESGLLVAWLVVWSVRWLVGSLGDWLVS